jgi:hypothetical protein
MQWPTPKRLSPAPGKRRARYFSRACDGSVIETLHFGLSEATIFDRDSVVSLRKMSVANTQQICSALTR